MSVRGDNGFSLVEVMVGMVITGVALIGAMQAVELSSRYLTQGRLTTQALAEAQARLEAKRSVGWQQLLQDDLDRDGVVDVVMRDDGTGGDGVAGDGIYSAMQELGGITLVWRVRLDHPGNLAASTVAGIEATASFSASGQSHTVRLATIRANPAYVGL